MVINLSEKDPEIDLYDFVEEFCADCKHKSTCNPKDASVCVFDPEFTQKPILFFKNEECMEDLCLFLKWYENCGAWACAMLICQEQGISFPNVMTKQGE